MCIISYNKQNNKIATGQNKTLQVRRTPNPMYDSTTSTSTSTEYYTINRKANNIIYLPQGDQRLCVNEVYGTAN